MPKLKTNYGEVTLIDLAIQLIVLSRRFSATKLAKLLGVSRNYVNQRVIDYMKELEEEEKSHES